jgi:hypothetical protein
MLKVSTATSLILVEWNHQLLGSKLSLLDQGDNRFWQDKESPILAQKVGKGRSNYHLKHRKNQHKTMQYSCLVDQSLDQNQLE